MTTITDLEITIKTLLSTGHTENDPLIVGLKKQKLELEQQAQSTQTPMYDTLVQNAKFPLSQEKKECIEETVDEFLNPKLSKEKNKEPGLLLGNIQCGKTDTFENIIGLAFDKGFDIAVVFTKNNQALTKQTLKRLKRDYVAFSPNSGHRVTVNIYDIMEIRNIGLNQATVDASKTVIVCKKQSDNLNSLIKLFNTDSNKYLKYKKILIVDDEADFASRNYRSSGRGDNKILDAYKTTGQIDDFRCMLDDCRYLQVTATPYSLLLQPEGQLNLAHGTLEPFKPRFVSMVPIHERYIGAKQYFEDSKDINSMYYHLFDGVADSAMQVLYKRNSHYLTEEGLKSQNLFDLESSICSYLFSTAIRRIQERECNSNADYHSSAIIHVEIGKNKHDWQCDLCEYIVKEMKTQFLSGKYSDWMNFCIKAAYSSLKASIDAGNKRGEIKVNYPSEQSVIDEIVQMFRIDNIKITKVNSDNEIINLLDEETGELRLDAAANIFIGGNVLDRGITIQHMLCFFYGRNPTTFQQDTVLQHARMFGARSLEDMAVTRFHTTNRIYQAFAKMCEIDDDIRKRIIENKKSGKDIGPIFMGYDKQIRICASSKTAASDINMVKGHQRILPIGFMAGYKTHIASIVNQIEDLITQTPGYSSKDSDGFFEIDKDRVVAIIHLIEKTYLYTDYYQNTEFENDLTNLLCSLEYALSCAPDKNKLYCWHITKHDGTGRDLNRLRSNGAYNDSPEGGSVYIDMARNKAIDFPVITLIKESGARHVDERGINIGWNNAEFYWPVLLTQKNISSAIYTIE